MSLSNIEYSKVITAVAKAAGISEKLLEKVNNEVVSASEKKKLIRSQNLNRLI